MTLEERVEKIEERNKRVEKDKAWETSKSRIVLLFLLTYFSMVLILTALRLQDPWINALIVAVGFLLSTLTLPWFRALWERYIYGKN